MKILSKDFRVREGDDVDLKKWPTIVDDKENARLIVSQVILDTLDELKMSYPQTSEERRKELLAIRKDLEK